MWKDLKAFILRGNVLDLAVGIVIGAAFGKIVSSLVSDIIMPPIGLLLGKLDFSNLYINLSGQSYPTLAAAKAAGAAVIGYGAFINTLIDFLIVSIAIFFVVRGVSKLTTLKKQTPAAPTDKDCPFCLSKIPLKAVRCPHCTSQLQK
jgi:large conductance mechanosensitive channel